MWHNLSLAVSYHQYEEAAVILNGFDERDIPLMVRQLQAIDWQPLRSAALKAMPGWSDRVVRGIDQVAAQANEAERVRILNQNFDTAAFVGRWEEAAVYLNAFNDYDIVRKLRPLGEVRIKEIAAAAPQGAFRVARIALGMLDEPATTRVQNPSRPAAAGQTTMILSAAAGMPFLPQLQNPGGPFRAPGLEVVEIKTPGFGPGSFRTPFVEPPPTVQVPASLPGSGAGGAAIDPVAPGVSAEIRLASAMGRILMIGAEVAQAAAIPLTLGAMGISDTNLEASNRSLRVSTVERMRKIVDDVNHRLSEALDRKDFQLIRDKVPGLYNAALDRSVYDLGLAIRLLKLAYGITVEKLVAEVALRDPFLSSVLDYVAGPNRADFYGKGFMRGLNFDVTTRRDRDRHTDPNLRPRYGENLITITYHPPWAEGGW
jgi:hypothetical protein